MSIIYKLYNTFRADSVPLVIQAAKTMVSNFSASSIKYTLYKQRPSEWGTISKQEIQRERKVGRGGGGLEQTALPVARIKTRGNKEGEGMSRLGWEAGACVANPVL